MAEYQPSPLMKIVFNCKKNNNLTDAKTLLSIASGNCPDLVLLDEIAYLQSEIKDYKGCIDSLKQCNAIAFNPSEKYSIRANLAKIYNHLNEPVLSLGYSNANLEVQYDYNTVMEIAFSHYLNGNYDESEKMMRELLTKKDLPDNVLGRVLYNLGSYDIEHGKFKEGMKGFIDIGHKIGIWIHREIPNVPVWDGVPVQGKTLLISSEGGIGDEFINIRFMNNISKLGMNPVWLTENPQLIEVFNRNGYETKSSLDGIDLSNSVQCMSMFLPILLDLDSTDLWVGSYIKPSEEYLEKWSKILPKGRKLALKWSGNPEYDQDLHRSIPIDCINSIRTDGTKINLQLEPSLVQDDMINVGLSINNIEDTLAILWLCDDIVTSCTSIAHMAGSMGKSCIVCPPIACYYVWLGNDGVSNWYSDNLKVVRQKKHKDWKSVITKVQEILDGS